MEKVRIFTRGTTDDFGQLEFEVSEWLDQQADKIDVIDRQVECVTGINVLREVYVNCTIVIFYRTKP